MSSINFWPILVSSVVAFGIGALWYSPILFGRDWMELSNMSEKDIEESSARGMWQLYIYQLILTIVVFGVLGFLIANFGVRTAGNGAFMAFLAWLGFALTQDLGELLWRKTPLKLVLISTICTLITWMIGGAIIGAWK